jgi:hypothetical protein
MEQETSLIIYEGIVVPESLLRRQERTLHSRALDAEDEDFSVSAL